MTPARIGELLFPFLPRPSVGHPAALTPDQLGHISTYIDILLRWSARVNLTAVREPDEIVTRHFGESFFAAAQLFPPASAVYQRADPLRVLDVGSGAGFPGLPLKIWAPSVHLTLIESSQKKVAFLREVIRALALPTATVFHGRAESYLASPNLAALNLAAHDLAAHDLAPVPADVVTLRAVERFTTILPTAATLVAPRGRLALLITTPQFASAQSLPNLTWAPPLPIPHSHHRILAIATKQDKEINRSLKVVNTSKKNHDKS